MDLNRSFASDFFAFEPLKSGQNPIQIEKNTTVPSAYYRDHFFAHPGGYQFGPVRVTEEFEGELALSQKLHGCGFSGIMRPKFGKASPFPCGPPAKTVIAQPKAGRDVSGSVIVEIIVRYRQA